MARTWDTNVNTTITCSIGACGSAGYGTLACVAYIDDTSDSNIFGIVNGANSRHAMKATTTLVGVYDGLFTSGGATIPADTWCILVLTKGNGAATPRTHVYNISTGAWTHTNVSSGTEVNATTLTNVQFGKDNNNGGPLGNSDIALAAIWAGTNMTDSEVERLTSLSVMHWLSLGPSGLWVFDQGNVAYNIHDWTGNGANQSARTNTTVSTRSVPLLMYGGPLLAVTVTATGGGTTYERSFSSSISHTATFARVAQNIRPISISVGHTSGTTRVVVKTRTLAISVSHTSAVSAAVSKLVELTSSIAHTMTLARVAQNIRALTNSISHTSAATSLRDVPRSLTSSITHTATFARVYAGIRALTNSIAHTASMEASGGSSSVTTKIWKLGPTLANWTWTAVTQRPTRKGPVNNTDTTIDDPD